MIEESTDVVIIGLGTMGSMTAWQLARRGVRTIGIEARGRVHPHGSFTGESRLFRVAAKEGARYIPALIEARKQWGELEEESGRQLLLPIGALSIGTPDRPEMVATLEAAEEFGLNHRLFTTQELAKAYPQFYLEPGDIGFLDTDGGGLRPELSVYTALERAEAHGADLRFHTPVLDIDTVPGGVVVHTAEGAIRAQHAVVAAGSWSARLDPTLGRIIKARPLPLTWFIPQHHELFTPDRLPVFMRDLTTDDLGEIHVFGAPSLDGYAVKVCPTSTVQDIYAEVETLPHMLEPDELTRLGKMAVRVMPDLNPEPTHHQLHHDGFTPDHIPVIDLSADGAVVTLAGFSGNGFKFAPIWGQMAAELALDGESSLYREEYSLASAVQRLEDR